MSDSDITKTSLAAIETSGDLEWINPRHGICFGVLRLNGAILYQITLDEDLYTVWWSPEELEEPTYLWSFYLLEKAKAYVEKRERDTRTQYSYSTT